MLLVIILLLYFYLSMHYKIYNSCKHWRDGIGGLEMDNDNEELCHVVEPKICW